MIKRIIKIGICFLLTAAFVMGMSLTAFAHSGRTDSRGGHNDTRNVSGLGSYHSTAADIRHISIYQDIVLTGMCSLRRYH